MTLMIIEQEWERAEPLVRIYVDVAAVRSQGEALAKQVDGDAELVYPHKVVDDYRRGIMFASKLGAYRCRSEDAEHREQEQRQNSVLNSDGVCTETAPVRQTKVEVTEPVANSDTTIVAYVSGFCSVIHEMSVRSFPSNEPRGG